MKKMLALFMMFLLITSNAYSAKEIAIVCRSEEVESGGGATDYTADSDFDFCFLMDEALATADLDDGTSNANDLQPASDPAVTTGKFGGGRAFDGSSDYFYNLDGNLNDLDTVYTGTQAMSIGAYVYADDTGDAVYISHTTDLILRVDGGKPQLVMNAFSSNDRVTSSENIPTGEWVHLCGIYNGTTMKIYINGVEKGSVTPTGSYGSSSDDWYVGRMDGGAYADGLMDDAFICQRALTTGTDSELESIINSGLNGLST